MVLIELLGRVGAAVPTVPELIQDRVIQKLPGPLFAFLLEHLLYLGKPLLFLSLLGGQILLAGLAGLVLGRWPRAIPLAIIVWILTGVLLAGLSQRGPFAGDPRVALVTLAAFAAYGFILRRVLASRADPPRAAAPAERRLLLAAGAMLVVSAWLARRVIGALPASPSPAPRTGEGASASAAPFQAPPGLPAPVTSADDFYVVSKNIVDPIVDVSSWRLRVEGLVDQSFALRYDDLALFPAVETYRTLECISNEVGGDLMSNGLWTGIRLADVLQRAGVQAGATLVVFKSADDYTETMPLSQALSPDTLLVYQLDGQPLPARHGFPLRVLGVGTYGMKNPKWLVGIEVAAQPVVGFWEEQGWTPDAPVQTMARIDTPDDGARLSDETITIGGVAFAADRGIQRVEVSTDGGASWREAALLPSLGPSTWTFWQFTWRPDRRGAFTLIARATDGTGQVQTAWRSDPYPSGASGYHTIQVQVSG